MLRFTVLVLLSILFSIFSSSLIFTDDILNQYFTAKLTDAEIHRVLENQEKWWWVGYAVIPVSYLVKISLVSFCLAIGLILDNRGVNLKTLFAICVTAEFVMLIPSVLTMVWFGFIKPDYTLQELKNFAPLSLFSLFDPAHLESWQRYPLRKISFFELAFILVLANGVRKYYYDHRFIRPLKIVLSSYGTGLAIWLLFVTYMYVTFS